MKKLILGILMLFALAFCVSAVMSLYPIGDQVVDEGETLIFQINTNTPNGTSEFTKNVTFGTLEKIGETNATFTWTPSYDDAGIYDVMVTVTDNSSSPSDNFTITVNNVNRAPTWVNLPSSRTVVQGYPETLDLSSYSNDEDTDYDVLTYSTTPENSSQVNCVINGNSLEISSVGGFIGDSSCLVQVTDTYLETANGTIDITAESQNPSVSISNVDFGNVNLNTTTSQESFSINNNGNIDLNNIAITWDSAYDKYNIDFGTSVATTLNAYNIDSAYVKIYIPADEDTGSLTIPVTFTSDEFNKTFNLNADVLGRLQITDLDVKVDDDSDTNIQDEADEYKIRESAKPESHIKFDVEVKNTFPGDNDPDIEEIVVTITIIDLDDDEDVEEESSEFDLKQDRDKKVTIEFDIPLKVNEEDYNVIIEVEGEDEDGNTHKVTKTLLLEVDKESHDLIIKKAYLSPEVVDCSRDIDLNVNVMNLGSNEEDEAVITIKSSALGIDISERDIELSEDIDDDDNEFEKTFELTIKDSVKAGTYTIEIRAYYGEDKLEDLERVTLQVKDCKPVVIPPVEEEEEEEEVEVIMPEEEEEITITPEVEEQPTKRKFTESTEYVLLLVLFNIIVIMVVAALLIALLRK